ncbi:MAG TPA: hypothetical protein VHD58_11095 [Mycobacteriales bacterium]|nr:hypothetical protein [Mycobacteriales bacterium]
MKLRHNRRLGWTLAAAAVASGLSATLAATATAAASGGAQTEHFTLYSGNLNNKDLVDVFQAAGPIRGVGTARADDEAKGAVPVHVSLPGGTLLIKAVVPFHWRADLTTCTATAHDTGTYRVVSGTGSYAGATGHGTYVEDGAGIGVRGADGSCEQKFKINYVVARLSGPVHVG